MCAAWERARARALSRRILASRHRNPAWFQKKGRGKKTKIRDLHSAVSHFIFYQAPPPLLTSRKNYLKVEKKTSKKKKNFFPEKKHTEIHQEKKPLFFTKIHKFLHREYLPDDVAIN